MGQHALIQSLDQDQLKDNIPDFSIGDTLRVSLKIVEGEKERTQVFQGTVIARKGRGIAETFSLHRVSYGEGMERVFNLHSPRIISIQVVKKGDVRRAKLYYLRGATGKQAKVQEKIGVKNRMNNSGSQSAQSESANDYDNDKNDFSESELSEPIENSTK